MGMNVVSGIYVKYVEDPNNNKDLNFNICDHSYHIRQRQTSMEDIVYWANVFYTDLVYEKKPKYWQGENEELLNVTVENVIGWQRNTQSSKSVLQS